MKQTILLLLFFTTAVCHAQTKVIAHKSHSGTSKTFMKAYKETLFDMKRSNFGLPGNMNIHVLDTVVAINDTVTVLKRRESNVCYPYKTKYTDLKDSDFEAKCDTLINDDVIIRRNTIAYIKAHGKYSIWYSNPIEQVVFIGFRE